MSKTRKKLIGFLKNLGPGLITGASDDDPSGIATYSQAGAQFGLSTLWTALITTPMMIAIQEMCARIGVVTDNGLAGVIKDHYPRWFLYLIVSISFLAIVLNIGADISAIGAVSSLLFPQIPALVFSVLFTVLLAVSLIKFSYKTIASTLKWLCFALFSYFLVPFLIKENWSQIALATILPTISIDKNFVLILVAVFGTTISPYLFFWQSSTEVESARHANKNLVVNKKIIHDVDIDVDAGMIFSNVIMFFIILTTGTVLFNSGVTNITTVDQAASALRPLAGNLAYLLFAIGVIGAGMIAIPVLAGSLSYIYSEIKDLDDGFDKKFHEAKGFYMTLVISLGIGLLIDIFGVSPIEMLIYSAVFYGLISPIIIAVILHISNNKEILGKYVNGRLSNALGAITLIVMTLLAVLLLYLQF